MSTARLALLALLLWPAATRAGPVFSADRIRAHVEFLADDLLEGRETGTRGHEIAARYVAAQFSGFGLTPAGADGGWLKPVVLSEARLGEGSARITVASLKGRAQPVSFENGGEAIIASSQLDAVTDVAAQAVFVGFGFDAPDQGLDDYKGLDVRGRIVVALAGVPKGPPSEIIAHLSQQRAKMAERRGAIGYVQIPTLQWQQLRPWERLRETATVPRMTWVQPDGAPYVLAPGIKASGQLSMAGARALFAGAPTPLDKVLAAADRNLGRPKGFALPVTVRIQANSVQRRLSSPEVIGMVPGSDPKLAGEFVVLMAHVDHLGIRPNKTDDHVYNGALDNAAGTAVMLEVARAFASDPVRTKRSILFIANTAEEKGLLGAEALANDPTTPIGQIVAVVDLDQPLLLYDFTDVIAFGGDHTTMGRAIARAVASAGVALAPDPMPEQTIFVRSDHYSFVKRGVPAIMLATGFANGGAEGWSHFLSTDYHQPTDDLKQPIHWQAGARFAQVNYLIARDIADAPERPSWYQGDYFGDVFAPGSPKAARPSAGK